MSKRDWRAYAAGVAALPADDPERIAAYARAEKDPELRWALSEAQSVLELFDQVAPAPPSSTALRLAEGAVLREMRSESGRVAVSGRLRIGFAFSVIATWWLMLLLHGVSPAEAVGPMALAILACGGLAAMLALGSGIAGLVLGIGAAGVTAVLAASRAAPVAHGAIAHGMPCAALAACAAVLPLALALGIVLARPMIARSVGAAGLAATAAAGALAGMAALEALCPHHALSHMLLFHAGGVALAALLGTAVGEGVLRLSRLRRGLQSR